MNKYSMIPAAAAITAAMLFGAQVQAQPNTTTPPGTTKAQDAVTPAPGNTAMPARAGAEANAPASTKQQSATMTPGTSKAKDNVSPAPAGGMAKSAEDRAAMKAAKAERRAAKKGSKTAVRATNANDAMMDPSKQPGGTK